MKEITKRMIEIYNLRIIRLDFMGYALEVDPTFHHIQKKENGGKYSLDNGAVLNHNSHNYLHILEYKDYKSFQMIQQMLKIINNKQELTMEDLTVINYILLEFEYYHSTDTNSRGKILVKDEYKNRFLTN